MNAAARPAQRSLLRSPNRRRELFRVAAWVALAAWPAALALLLH